MMKKNTVPEEVGKERKRIWATMVRDNGSAVTLTKDKPAGEDEEHKDGMTMVWGS